MGVSKYFNYSRSQRTGISLLVILIIGLQAAYFYWSSKSDSGKNRDVLWSEMQREVDSLDNVGKNDEKANVMYPFNPNFITDYKGYTLGMSVEEIDRLHKFRKENKYVNSASEFQKVTGVSDSLLAVISPYFKFPGWVNNQKSNFAKPYSEKQSGKASAKVMLDINEASQDDLTKVYGIGQTLSGRIIKEREKLGGFVSIEQLNFIWGLSPEVVENLKKSFEIQKLPDVEKININNSTTKQLADFPYFNYSLAKEIVTFRTMNNGIQNIDDLTKIKGFPVEKKDFIALYLEF